VNQFAFSVAGHPATWALVVAVVLTQFVAIALWSGFSRAKFAKAGMRSSERALLGSSALLLTTWLVVFDVMSLMKENVAPGAAQASVSGSVAKGSCASLRNGMRSSEIRSKVGDPDQVIAEDDVRGPGAEVWIYKDRCAAHVFQSKLEFVE